jgi:hypothetical protein
VPASEQSINGSPDKHKGMVRATRALCSRETRCSAAKWSDTTARTRVSTLACSLSRVRACGRVHSGRTGRAEGFDPAGVCVRICADVGGAAAARDQRRVHGDETLTRARRADLGEAVFRVKVAKKVRTWGPWLDGHTCAGALEFAATAQRNGEHGHR